MAVASIGKMLDKRHFNLWGENDSTVVAGRVVPAELQCENMLTYFLHAFGKWKADSQQASSCLTNFANKGDHTTS